MLYIYIGRKKIIKKYTQLFQKNLNYSLREPRKTDFSLIFLMLKNETIEISVIEKVNFLS